MSKSDKDQNGCVYMLEKPEDIMRKFKKAVTDSDACVRFDPENKPGVSNLMQIYSAGHRQDLCGDRGGVCRAGLRRASRPPWASPWWSCCGPIREETERLLADKAYLESVYRAGAEKACLCSRTAPCRKVYKKVGFLAR